MKEIFKDIPGFEGIYQVSDSGRVKSLSRSVPFRHSGKIRIKIIKERILKPLIDRYGYATAGLTSKNRTKKYWKVHRLVLLAFTGPSEKEVNHIDYNKQNNNIENLEYCTLSHNQKHKHAGNPNIMPRGSKHYRSKLTEDDVLMIFKLRDEGVSAFKISELYKIHYIYVFKILRKEAWAHLHPRKNI